jgi:hypothetical protein
MVKPIRIGKSASETIDFYEYLSHEKEVRI